MGELGIRTGRLASGLEHMTWGRGPRRLLVLQGGPGSAVPTGWERQVYQRLVVPFVDHGFTASVLTRRRGMPPGHDVAGMADDLALTVDQEWGGHVDVVLGLSFGGIIAQYFAARHGDLVDHVVLVASGCVVAPWGAEVDARYAVALVAGRRREAARILAEHVLPGRGWSPVRHAAGPLLASAVLREDRCPLSDVAVEAHAELRLDTRPVLPGITIPVLLVAGRRDRLFPPTVMRETSALIPGSTLVWRSLRGHVTTVTDPAVAELAVAWRAAQSADLA